VDLADLREQLVGVELDIVVFGGDPADELGERDPQRVVQRPVGADAPSAARVLEPRPRDLLSLDHVDLDARVHRTSIAVPGDLAVAHRRVAVAEIQQRAADVTGKYAVLPALASGASMLPPCSAGVTELRASRAGATPRQPRNGCSGILTLNVRVERPERRFVLRAVDRIEPDLLRHGACSIGV
jgi:hypothetical protein